MNVPKLLIIGYVWPEPDSSAAGSRMMQLIQFFRKEFQVSFATTAVQTPYMADLKALGISQLSIELNNESFDVLLKEYSPDVVLFDRFMMEEQFGWRVEKVCPDALKILDTEDLHFLRKARQSAAKNTSEPSSLSFQTETAKREIASIYRCDLSLIISEKEMEILTMDFQVPDFLLHYLPLFGEVPGEEEILPSFEERKGFVSIGNFRHEPNWDAVLQLKQNIWPLIRKEIPEATLQIYGAYPTQKVFQLDAPKDGFHIKGRADSAREVIKKSRVLLAPLRFGAGIKGKFIDAMSLGTPSVTTNIGAEAMAGNYSWGGRIEDEAKAFAMAAIDLYMNRDEWELSRGRGFRIIRERFAIYFFEGGFLERLKSVMQNLHKHRERNFTGAMLQHHRVNSTHYLSKYIEMKTNYLSLANKKNTH